MRVFLSGAMGSGKTSVAREMAQLTRLPAFDLDEMIARNEGRSAQQIFAESGEGAFRDAERTALAMLLLDLPMHCIVALGGGTVLDASSRRQLLASGVVVTLTATAEELARRVGDGCGRPLLHGSPDTATVLSEILQARAGVYGEAHGQVDTTHLSPSEVANAVRKIAERDVLVVPLLERTSRVHVQEGLALGLAEFVARSTSTLVVTDSNVDAAWGERVRETLPPNCHWLVLSPGESAKTLASAQLVWDAALDANLDRKGCIVAFGGGVVGDVAGFAAATFMRGVRFVNVPTTLLAMADSCIGGKTAVDVARGKNVIGAFHHPSDVVIDTDLLSTLAIDERRSGLGEIVKVAILDGEGALQALERNAESLLSGDPDALRLAIFSALRLKAAIVSADPDDQARRRTLNLGHTVGHALEAGSQYRGLLHGEAVAEGLTVALRVGVARGLTDPSFADRVERLLKRLGLYGLAPRGLFAAAAGFVGADKKRGGHRIDFIVPCAPGDVRIVSMPLSELQAVVANLARQ
ncbi:MAG: 3-dehydroquinate synthase [Sandaracinaceae bacterium]|nr:3-dehydroquinate synthase [Sandaracinaceae bacterium]